MVVSTFLDLGALSCARLHPVPPWPRFPSPLIERSVRFSRTALSDWFHIEAYCGPTRDGGISLATPNSSKIAQSENRPVPRDRTLRRSALAFT